MASAALPEAVVSKKNVNVKYAFTCAIFASMASIILGYDIGVMSGASLYIKKDLKITDVQLEILVGIMNLYSLIGAFAAGRTSDWIGRRFTVVFAAAIFFAGALLMGFAVSYGMLMAGRFVAGVGVGYAIMIAPVYTAEISPAASRGLLTSFPDFFINLGILLGYVSNYAFARLPLYLSWRVMLGIGAAPSVLLALMVFVMPESPQWLVKKGRLADARAVLEKTSDTPEEAAERLADIKAAAGIPKDLDGDVVTVPKERHGETQVWKELVLSPTPAMRRILLSALGIHFFQQASGSDCVVLYSPRVFKSAGITGDNQLLGTTCAVGVSKTLFILVATFLLDRVGRRPLLLCSAGGMMVSLVGLGTGLTVVGHHPDEKIPWAVALCIASTLAYVAFFSVGLGYRRRRDPRRGDRRRSNAGVLATTPAPLVLPVPATANSPSALLYPSPSPSTAPSICWSPPQLSSPSPPPNSSPSPSISPTTENSSSPAFFNVDECFKPWVLRSASKKWKDFKAVLKRTYFDPNLTRRQNIHNGCGRRIPDSQWEWLVKYWKTSKSQDKCEKNKAIRAAQLNGTHTTGSRSFAVTLDQMEIKEGRQVARAELYIVTHTKRNGEPVDKYSGDNINQIRKQFAANPSLVGEEARDGDVFSGLFPKERNGRWRGLGLLVGGTASKELAEVKAELHETKTENLRLWSVIQALQKNQSALQEQHNDLKDMLLSSQRQHGHGDRDQKILPESKDPLEDIEADNQDREVSISYKGSKRSKLKTKFEENETISSQHISKKRQPTRQLEKTPPSLQLKGQTIISDKNQHKKTRRFQTPLQKGGLAVLKRGLEVGLISPQSTSMVAFATVQAADRRSKCTDGRPLEDCVEVLINTVFSKTTLLPRSHGNISKLASAVGKCIPWPRKNIEPLDDGSGDLPTTKASSVTASDNGAPKEHSVKRKKVNSISLSGQPVSTTCT